jgi:phosphoglycolate phosphatase
MKRFDLLIFDWDGTLMDSAGAIVHAIQAACTDLDLRVPDDAACRQIIGLGLTEALTALLPELPEAEHRRLVDRYRHHYLGQDGEIELFPGVVEGIAALREAGFRLAVATGKSRQGLDRAFVHSGLRDQFEASRCADESFSKPHPGMVLELLDAMMVDAGRALVIGDTSHDLLMAANAGVAALAVSYGAHEAEHLAEHAPLACVESFPDVRAWIERNA